MVKPGLKKGKWTEEEDAHVIAMVTREGVDKVKWAAVADGCSGRLGKQCRERWLNHLDPQINKVCGSRPRRILPHRPSAPPGNFLF